MPVRTSADRVSKIIDYDTELIPDIQPFINDASVMVDTLVATDASVSANVLELVERYLAAHFIAITDPRVATEQVGSLLTTYQYKLAQGLAITHYGSMAMFLDTSGRLSNWNNRVIEGIINPQIFWAGKA